MQEIVLFIDFKNDNLKNLLIQVVKVFTGVVHEL